MTPAKLKAHRKSLGLSAEEFARAVGVTAGDRRYGLAVVINTGSTDMQRSFSRLWDNFSTDMDAKSARDEFYRDLRGMGIKARRFVLKNQLKQYVSFGVPDGRSCDCYFVDFDGQAAADAGFTQLR